MRKDLAVAATFAKEARSVPLGCLPIPLVGLIPMVVSPTNDTTANQESNQTVFCV